MSLFTHGRKGAEILNRAEAAEGAEIVDLRRSRLSSQSPDFAVGIAIENRLRRTILSAISARTPLVARVSAPPRHPFQPQGIA